MNPLPLPALFLASGWLPDVASVRRADWCGAAQALLLRSEHGEQMSLWSKSNLLLLFEVQPSGKAPLQPRGTAWEHSKRILAAPLARTDGYKEPGKRRDRVSPLINAAENGCHRSLRADVYLQKGCRIKLKSNKS